MAKFVEEIGIFLGGSVAPLIQKSVSGQQQCVKAFSQCRDPVRSWIGQRSKTAGGICDALASNWIYYDAGKGTLWNWLEPKGEVDYLCVAKLMDLQMDAEDSVNQRSYMLNWLKENKIYEIRQETNVITRVRGAEGKTGCFSCADLANEITRDKNDGNPQYKKIGIYGKGGGHTMAAWVDKRVEFFDPNFGEFWFPSTKEFVAWFTGKFWFRSLYFAGLSGTFQIDTLSP